MRIYQAIVPKPIRKHGNKAIIETKKRVEPGKKRLQTEFNRRFWGKKR